MEILAHRGYWKYPAEKNSAESFKRAFESGFGIETDIRDFNGKIIISHDIPQGSKLLYLDDVLKIHADCPNFSLALNIKSDGLQAILMDQLSFYDVKNYFVFDMSVPDAIGYEKAGCKYFTRQSEYEMVPSLYENANGIWLDCFNSTWFDEELIYNHVQMGKEVAIVSPELHGRYHLEFWAFLSSFDSNILEKVYLCTDYPDEAINYFNLKK
jgi:hypothetical protein